MSERCLYRMVDPWSRDDGPVIVKKAIIRETPRGYWICDLWALPHFQNGKETAETRQQYGAKFVLNGTGRRYAYPTRELAQESYIIRKERQIQHARNSIASAEAALTWLRAGKPPQDEFFTFDDFKEQPQ